MGVILLPLCHYIPVCFIYSFLKACSRNQRNGHSNCRVFIFWIFWLDVRVFYLGFISSSRQHMASILAWFSILWHPVQRNQLKKSDSFGKWLQAPYSLVCHLFLKHCFPRFFLRFRSLLIWDIHFPQRQDSRASHLDAQLIESAHTTVPTRYRPPWTLFIK